MEFRAKKILCFSGLLLLFWLCARFLLPFFLPFLLGTGLALASEPAVRFLCRQGKLPRALAAGVGVSATLAGALAIIMLVLGLLFRQFPAPESWVPRLTQTVGSGMGLLQKWLLTFSDNLPQGLQSAYRKNVAEFFSGGTALLERASGFALGTAGAVITGLPDAALCLGTGLLSAFLISARLSAIGRYLSEKLPRQQLEKWLRAFRRLRDILESWLGSQCKLLAITFCILSIGFCLLRIGSPLLIAALVSLVDALPVLGTGTVLLPWSLVCLLSGDGGRALGLLGLYAVAALLRSILEPKIIGKHLGLDPLATLIAMYCGYRLWGIAGMLLLPMLSAAAMQMLPGKE
mgnify:FL=1